MAVVAAMGGGVVAAFAELSNATQAVAMVGLIVFLGGVLAAGAWVIADARQTGSSLRSSAWKGIKATGSLLWHLAP